MENPKKELDALNRNFHLHKYADILFIIIFALSGAIHMIQLRRWLCKNNPDNAKAVRWIVEDWERFGMVNKVHIGRNDVLYMRAPVYNYFGLTYYHPATSQKLKRTALLMEKFLTEEKFYLKTPTELKVRLSKTNAVLFLPNGEAHKRVVQNYINALAPYGWDMTGLNDQLKLMQAHIDRSPVNSHFVSKKESIEKDKRSENLYSLGCKNIYLTGAKLHIEPNGTVCFSVHVDFFSVTATQIDKLAERILKAYQTVCDMLYDPNPNRKADVIITIYSHHSEDKRLIERTYNSLKSYKEFASWNTDTLKEHIKFVFFGTEITLFGGYSFGRIV